MAVGPKKYDCIIHARSDELRWLKTCKGRGGGVAPGLPRINPMSGSRPQAHVFATLDACAAVAAGPAKEGVSVMLQAY